MAMVGLIGLIVQVLGAAIIFFVSRHMMIKAEKRRGYKA